MSDTPDADPGSELDPELERRLEDVAADAATAAEEAPAAGSVAAEPAASPKAAGSRLRRLKEAHLLGFYDRLRERTVRTVEQKGGKLSGQTVKALLLVPDVFMLLVRLALDPEVPKPTRALIGGALVYFVLPVDLLPEAMIGGAGYLDDLALASAILAQAFSGELEVHAKKYWSGHDELRVVLRDVTQAAHSLLGDNVYGRLQRMLARRGVRLEDAPAPRRVQSEDFEDARRPAFAERDEPYDPDLERLSPDELLEHGEEHA